MIVFLFTLGIIVCLGIFAYRRFVDEKTKKNMRNLGMILGALFAMIILILISLGLSQK